MVKVGTNVEAHQWSSSEQKWLKVGDVVGSSGGGTKGRTMFEGKVCLCILYRLDERAQLLTVCCIVVEASYERDS